MKKQTVIHEHLYRNLDSISKFVQQVLQNLPTESDPKQKPATTGWFSQIRITNIMKLSSAQG
ncbi:hypothetical protein Lpp123_07300, partial [Lacticaseibacillus paracasei subsp. paracasei Lpp123]